MSGGKAGKKESYEIEYENLAVPEVHTGHVKQDPKKDSRKEKKHGIVYDSVAVPEVHIPKRK